MTQSQQFLHHRFCITEKALSGDGSREYPEGTRLLSGLYLHIPRGDTHAFQFDRWPYNCLYRFSHGLCANAHIGLGTD
jgi:hypothetical protein